MKEQYRLVTLIIKPWLTLIQKITVILFCVYNASMMEEVLQWWEVLWWLLLLWCVALVVTWHCIATLPTLLRYRYLCVGRRTIVLVPIIIVCRYCCWPITILLKLLLFVDLVVFLVQLLIVILLLLWEKHYEVLYSLLIPDNTMTTPWLQPFPFITCILWWQWAHYSDTIPVVNDCEGGLVILLVIDGSDGRGHCSER